MCLQVGSRSESRLLSSSNILFKFPLLPFAFSSNCNMFSTLEVAAKGLLADPSWNWVFKNTFDAMEEQLNKVQICPSRFLDNSRNLDSSCDGFCGCCREIFIQFGLRYFEEFCELFSLCPGDLLCIVNSIAGNDTQLDIATIAGPFHGSLSAYAAQEPPCFNKVFSSPSIPVVGFIKYGPVFLMIQVMTLITVERISIFFPRMRQKIERFYHSVVEVKKNSKLSPF